MHFEKLSQPRKLMMRPQVRLPIKFCVAQPELTMLFLLS